MKTLYIFDNIQYSSTCGIGTYLKSITRIVKGREDMQLCMIMFQTQVEQCCTLTSNGVNYILYPKNLCHNPFNEKTIVAQSLTKFINDSKENYFLFNYAPSEDLVKGIKNFFPQSTCISVVHDLHWTAPLLGNVHLFKSLIKGKRNTQKHQYIVELYKQEKEQYENSDLVICLSKDTWDVLQECYCIPSKKIRLIPHGVSIPKASEQSNNASIKRKSLINKDEKILLTVGRISHSKGTFALLHAFKSVLKEYPNCRWIIAGNMNQAPELAMMARDVITQISFTGHLCKKELSKWYRTADIGIIPSYTEQCSYVGLEMMKYGLPIVASNGFGLRCMFKDGFNASIASITGKKEDYIRKLTHCILCLLNNPQKSEYLKKNALHTLKKYYSYQKMKKEYKSIFMC